VEREGQGKASGFRLRASGKEVWSLLLKPEA
jgi:hypothetical protein